VPEPSCRLAARTIASPVHGVISRNDDQLLY
jgi:hypothetical protein